MSSLALARPSSALLCANDVVRSRHNFRSDELRDLWVHVAIIREAAEL